MRAVVIALFCLLTPVAVLARSGWENPPKELVPTKERLAREIREQEERWKKEHGSDLYRSLRWYNRNDKDFESKLLSPAIYDSLTPFFYLFVRPEPGGGTVNEVDDKIMGLWHDNGFYWNYDRSGADIVGARPYHEAVVSVINELLPAGHFFMVQVDPRENPSKYVGVVEGGNLIIYDIYGSRFNGIDGLIKSRYGSLKKYARQYFRVLEKAKKNNSADR